MRVLSLAATASALVLAAQAAVSTTLKRVQADGITVFYREAGSPSAPTILLLHGFPTSSHSFRNLIPRLAAKYHVVAPDLPAFGFTEIPASRNYTYTFDNLATTTTAFVDALGLKKFAIYIFDYGAPVGMRIAVARPTAVSAIISQNGNAYEEGLNSTTWAPIRALWADQRNTSKRDALRGMLTVDFTKAQYTSGAFADQADPATWTVDSVGLAQTAEAQLDLLGDYGANVALYSTQQAYLRKYQPPVLAVWGTADPAFVSAGAYAWKKDVPTAQVVLLSACRLPLETHLDAVSSTILNFLSPLRLA